MTKIKFTSTVVKIVKQSTQIGQAENSKPDRNNTPIYAEANLNLQSRLTTCPHKQPACYG